jgi:hypothetical protein
LSGLLGRALGGALGQTCRETLCASIFYLVLYGDQPLLMALIARLDALFFSLHGREFTGYAFGLGEAGRQIDFAGANAIA